MERFALSSLSLKQFRELYEQGILHRYIPNYNQAEIEDIYDYSDVNTVLLNAVRHNFIRIARSATRAGGQFLLKIHEDIPYPLSTEMVRFVLARHNDPRAHLSDRAKRSEREILKYNAILFDNRPAMNILRVNLDVEHSVPEDYDSYEVCMALIAKGDVATLRRILERYPEKTDQMQEYLLHFTVGASGKWEMYEFACQTILGTNIAVWRDHDDDDEDVDVGEDINHYFIFGALYAGKFNTVQRFLDHPDIRFRFSQHYNMLHELALGWSRHFIEIQREMRPEMDAAGFVPDYARITSGAIKSRNMENLRYLASTGDIKLEQGVRGEMNLIEDIAKAESMSILRSVMPKDYMVNMEDEEVVRYAIYRFILDQNNIQIIQWFMARGLRIELNMLAAEVSSVGLTSNTAEFIYNNTRNIQFDDESLYIMLYDTITDMEMHAADNIAYMYYTIVYVPNTSEIRWDDLYETVIIRSQVPFSREIVDLFTNVMHIDRDTLRDIAIDALRDGLIEPQNYRHAMRYAAGGNKDVYDRLMLALQG